MLSSLGTGTYLGDADKLTDEAVAAGIVTAVHHGWNVIDTASNYRGGRAEVRILIIVALLQAKSLHHLLQQQPGHVIKLTFGQSAASSSSRCLLPPHYLTWARDRDAL